MFMSVYHKIKRKRIWSKDDLTKAVKNSTSYRQVIGALGLRLAGGNYDQVRKYIKEYRLSVKHFKGKAWNKGKKFDFKPIIKLNDILVKNSTYQSFKLKKRLFIANLRKPWCEECGWAKISDDGRLPLELDHINGDRHDNRLDNLRILCPNCHSLKPTHRGRNRLKRGPVA